MTAELFIGLMSGTSLDGVDAVLADFSGASPRVLASAQRFFDSTLRATLLELSAARDGEIERAALAANELSRRYAAAAAEVLAASSVTPSQVVAIGCHGQTIRHRPELGYSVQIGNAALLAELAGIRVVSDFRSRDIAAGGQGAPLVPAFHAAQFASRTEDRAVLNLGGIANLTLLPRGGEVTGFDCGPGNCLMDRWAALHLGAPLDEDGAWAAGARPSQDLLERLQQEPFFSAAPPKSTGRDLFSEAWLRARLGAQADPRAVQATLLELTATVVAASLRRAMPRAARVIACGGGTRNRALMSRLAEVLAPAALETSERHGLAPTLVEATAFAWLARQALRNLPGNLPAVTGARGPRVLGAIYPA